MGRTLTPERQKLKIDAIRLRQEMGWSERRIARHVDIDYRTIHRWLPRNITHAPPRYGLTIPLNTVHVMDCIEGMAKIPHEYIDLVFADPPYNLGFSYGNNGNGLDKKQHYLDWCRLWFESVYRILKYGGSFYCMQYPEICADWTPILRGRFSLQRWITWHYPTNVGQSPNNWTRSQRTILFCTKGDAPGYFNGLADPQPYRNPTDKRIQENLKERPGVTPYDVWEYNLVKNVSKDKGSWPNQLPVGLLERIIKISCPPGGIVCDPFIGSGTTAVASVRDNREWIGFDLTPEAKKETESRVGKL